MKREEVHTSKLAASSATMYSATLTLDCQPASLLLPETPVLTGRSRPMECAGTWVPLSIIRRFAAADLLPPNHENESLLTALDIFRQRRCSSM